MRPTTQNIRNSLSVLEEHLKEKYVIPKEMFNETAFFSIMENRFQMVTHTLQKFEKKIIDLDKEIDQLKGFRE